MVTTIERTTPEAATIIRTDLLELGILALEHDTCGQCRLLLRDGKGMHCIEGYFAELLAENEPERYRWAAVGEFEALRQTANFGAFWQQIPKLWDVDWDRVHPQGARIAQRAAHLLHGHDLAYLNDFKGVSFGEAAVALRQAREEIGAEEGR